MPTTRTTSAAGPRAAPEAPRLVLLPGLETASGAPVLTVATGPAHRPLLRAVLPFRELRRIAAGGEA